MSRQAVENWRLAAAMTASTATGERKLSLDDALVRRSSHASSSRARSKGIGRRAAPEPAISQFVREGQGASAREGFSESVRPRVPESESSLCRRAIVPESERSLCRRASAACAGERAQLVPESYRPAGQWQGSVTGMEPFRADSGALPRRNSDSEFHSCFTAGDLSGPRGRAPAERRRDPALQCRCRAGRGRRKAGG